MARQITKSSASFSLVDPHVLMATVVCGSEGRCKWQRIYVSGAKCIDHGVEEMQDEDPAGEAQYISGGRQRLKPHSTSNIGVTYEKVAILKVWGSLTPSIKVAGV